MAKKLTEEQKESRGYLFYEASEWVTHMEDEDDSLLIERKYVAKQLERMSRKWFRAQ